MLREPTNSVWQALSAKPELDGFILVGGSALALHLNHRISEDLDFAWPYPRLPREPLAKLARGDSHLQFSLYQNPWAEREASDCGFDLDDFSQNYRVNEEVKVTFFCPDAPEIKILAPSSKNILRVATIPEIFAMKALVSAKRCKARDWYDLYILMKHHGFSWKDFYGVFVRAENEGQYDNAANMLSTGVPGRSDEGYTALIADAPSVEEMRDYFLQLRNAYERGED